VNHYFYAPNHIVPMRNLQNHPIRLIEVEGEGKLVLKPEIVTLRVGVITEDTDATIAQQNNAKLINTLILSLQQGGIDQQKIETVTYQVQPQYQYEGNTPIVKGFVVNHVLSVTLDDISRAGEIYDIAFKNGANLAETPIYTINDEKSAERHALQLAVRDASAKAHAIAQTLNVTLQRNPVKVSEMSTNHIVRESMSQKLFTLADGSTTSINVNEIEILSRVKAQYTW